MGWKWIPTAVEGVWIRNWNAVPMLPDERERMLAGWAKYQAHVASRVRNSEVGSGSLNKGV